MIATSRMTATILAMTLRVKRARGLMLTAVDNLARANFLMVIDVHAVVDVDVDEDLMGQLETIQRP